MTEKSELIRNVRDALAAFEEAQNDLHRANLAVDAAQAALDAARSEWIRAEKLLEGHDR